MDQVTLARVTKLRDKIVDYSFDRNEKSNVLAIHQTRPLIAYLINIQRTTKISKGWSGNDSVHSHQNGAQGTPIGSSNNNITNQSIRIIDYDTRQRCLAKGVYHARPADCVFTINSRICSQADIIKLAVVDRASNVYLYDLSYHLNDLTASRIAVIRAPDQEPSPLESIILVWCPFVPCDDFEDGDGGLRLALSTNKKIELFAVDRLQGKSGELQRKDLIGAYKSINDADDTNIVTLSISPDCSTISAAASNNRVTFFSSDIDGDGQRCLHNWEVNITDRSSISKLFFLDDYPRLLEDSSMKFWGAAFIGTKSGQMLLVDLRTWTVYQRTNIQTDNSLPKNFDYKIDCTSKNVVALNGNQCYVVQIDHGNRNKISSGSSSSSHQNDTSSSDINNMGATNGIYTFFTKSASTPRDKYLGIGRNKHQANTTGGSPSNTDICLPKIIRTTRLSLEHQIYSFVIKHKSDDELDLFTISAYSLERYTIDLNAKAREEYTPPKQPTTASSSLTVSGEPPNLDVAQMDRLVEALFTKLNTAFSQGLEEFLNDVKCEINDLEKKLSGLCRDVRKLQQQLQDVSRHK